MGVGRSGGIRAAISSENFETHPVGKREPCSLIDSGRDPRKVGGKKVGRPPGYLKAQGNSQRFGVRLRELGRRSEKNQLTTGGERKVTPNHEKVAAKTTARRGRRGEYLERAVEKKPYDRTSRGGRTGRGF